MPENGSTGRLIKLYSRRGAEAQRTQRVILFVVRATLVAKIDNSRLKPLLQRKLNSTRPELISAYSAPLREDNMLNLKR
jgi:hypothetical protein